MEVFRDLLTIDSGTYSPHPSPMRTGFGCCQNVGGSVRAHRKALEGLNFPQGQSFLYWHCQVEIYVQGTGNVKGMRKRNRRGTCFDQCGDFQASDVLKK